MSAPTAHPVQNRSSGAGPAGRLHPFPVAVVVLSALFMLVVGAWCLLWPAEFAALVGFAASEHFVHDAGAFQVGIGVGLVLALLWRDPVAVALAAFLVTNTVHAVNHVVDLDLGGRVLDAWALGALSVLLAFALWRHLGTLGHVVGRVVPATTPSWAPFVEQKTIVLSTYRRDGSPVTTPVSIAVDGDRAVVRSFEKAGKTRRLSRDPAVGVAPSTSRGTPTGPAVRARARRLEGTEARQAARLLRRKYPVLHGVLVPLAHNLGRVRTGRTVHFELRPDAHPDTSTTGPTGDRDRGLLDG